MPESGRFLFVMWEGGGTVPPELAVARRLVARGHTVHVLGENPIGPDARSVGCSFSGFVRGPNRASRAPEDDPGRDWEGSPLAGFKRMRDNLFCGPAFEMALDVIDAAGEQNSDAVVVDAMLFGAMVGAEKTGLPSAALHPHCPMRPWPGRTPTGLGLRPAAGPLSRARDAFFRWVMRRIMDTGMPPIAAARVELGLPPLRSPFDLEDRLDLVLALTSQHFDFPFPDPPANLRYVGPQLDDPPWAEPWTSPWPGSDERPLVVVSLGSTFQDQRDVLQTLVDALSRLEVRGLVTLGAVFEAGELSTPENVVVVRSAPHAQVLPEAHVVVTHGGHGTMLKSLAAGKPILCVPLGRDQSDNATRLEAIGAGIRHSPKTAAADLAASIERLLEDPSYRSAAQTMAGTLSRELARDAAVEALESLVR